MKTIQISIFLLSSLIVSVVSTYAQNDTLTTSLDSKLHGLKKIENAELKNVRLIELTYYSKDGLQLTWSDYEKIGLYYDLDFYADENDQITVAVLKPISQENIEKIKNLIKKRYGNDKFIGSQAKSFFTMDLDGNRVFLDDFKGNVIVLYYNCSDVNKCFKDKRVHKLLQEYDREGKIKFFTFTDFQVTDSNPELRNIKSAFHILLTNKKVQSDYKFTTSFPVFVIIDQNLKITYYHAGTSAYLSEIIKDEIGNLLEE